MADAPTILVPLDGSALSERALPYAARFAEALGAQVVLLTAWPRIEHGLRWPGAPDPDAIERGSQEAAEAYLGEARARFAPGARLTALARGGDPAHEILTAADEMRPRLIVMTTHGRTGLQRWRLGSVAHRVVHESRYPVLVIGPAVLERPESAVTITSILAPLDGSGLSEAALPLTRELAEAFDASVTLARVVPFAVQAYPFSPVAVGMPALDEELERGARQYLEARRNAVPGARIAVYHGSASGRLCDAVENEGFDLVAMATHARSGVGRALLGSTADRMLHCRAPVLLVRPE